MWGQDVIFLGQKNCLVCLDLRLCEYRRLSRNLLVLKKGGTTYPEGHPNRPQGG